MATVEQFISEHSSSPLGSLLGARPVELSKINPRNHRLCSVEVSDVYGIRTFIQKPSPNRPNLLQAYISASEYYAGKILPIAWRFNPPYQEPSGANLNINFVLMQEATLGLDDPRQITPYSRGWVSIGNSDSEFIYVYSPKRAIDLSGQDRNLLNEIWFLDKALNSSIRKDARGHYATRHWNNFIDKELAGKIPPTQENQLKTASKHLKDYKVLPSLKYI